MKLVSITPKNGWEWMFEQPIAMCLTHLVQRYPEYKEMIKNRPENCYVILDNSIVELGESVSLQDILNAADDVHANEIILRDAYPNGPRTIERIKEDIQYLKDNNLIGKYKIMAVCHGENLEEFKQTFEFINSTPEIDVIGIPKVLSKWVGERSKLSNIFMNTNKQLHFLGSWYSLKELLDLPKNVWDKVRSCDTCLPSLYVIQNKHVWEDRDGTIDLEKDYKELTKTKYNDILNEFNLNANNIFNNPSTWLTDDERYFLFIENFN